MALCPQCNSAGADILLNKVFCPNKECQWYDELTEQRLEDKVKGLLDNYVRNLRELELRSTDPDKTPTWHPAGGD